MKKTYLNRNLAISIAMIIMLLVSIITISVLTNSEYAFAEETEDSAAFSIEEEYVNGEHITRCKNLGKYKSKNKGQTDLLKRIGYTDDDIKNMSSETKQLYLTTEYFESRTTEYLVPENSNNALSTLSSETNTYKKLIVTSTLAYNGESNGNDRYVASIKAVWTSFPLNQLTDYLYIASGVGAAVYNSQYSECYLSYRTRTIIPGYGYKYTYPKYTNNDGSGKIVPHNLAPGGEGWKINVPFMPIYNQSHSNITFFMQSEISLPKNATTNVCSAYFHQKVVGSTSISLSISGGGVSFGANKVMDIFAGPGFTIENGVLL